MRVEIGIPRVCLGLLLFFFYWISLYSANNEFLSYDHFVFSFCLISAPALLPHLESPDWDKVEGLLKVESIFIVFLRSLVFLFYAQIMPRGTYLDAKK